MRRVILGVALAGVVASIAVLTQSQMSDKEGGARNASDSAGRVLPAAPVDSSNTLPDPLAEPQTAVPTPDGSSSTAPAPAPSPESGERPKSAERPHVDLPVIEDDQSSGAAVLRRAATAYKNVSSMRADFVNKRDNPLLSSTSTYRGTLYQKRPDKFLMKFSDPAGDMIVSDGRYFWLYYPSADRRQVLRAPAQTGAAGGVDLQAQFLGDPLTRFTHTYHGQQSVGGRSTHVLTLVPRQNAGYKSLKVWIDAKDALVRRFVLTENNGLVQEFALSGLVVNPSLSNDLFVFKPPADARIIERP